MILIIGNFDFKSYLFSYSFVILVSNFNDRIKDFYQKIKDWCVNCNRQNIRYKGYFHSYQSFQIQELFVLNSICHILVLNFYDRIKDFFQRLKDWCESYNLKDIRYTGYFHSYQSFSFLKLFVLTSSCHICVKLLGQNQRLLSKVERLVCELQSSRHPF